MTVAYDTTTAKYVTLIAGDKSTVSDIHHSTLTCHIGAVVSRQSCRAVTHISDSVACSPVVAITVSTGRTRS